MAASLLGSLDQLINQPFVSTVADRLGENPQNVSRGMKASATSILAGLANKSHDAGTMSQVFSTITSPSNDFRSITDASRLADVAQTSGGIGDVSSRFVNNLFGDKLSQVTDIAARTSGLSGSSGSAIMRLAAPLVLGLLSRTVRERGLDQGSFTHMLSGERDNIMRAAPAGLSSVLGGERPSGAWAHEREVHYGDTGRAYGDTSREQIRTDRTDYTRYREEPKVHRPRWIWPAVAALALLALFWGARGRQRRVPTYDTAAGNVATPRYDTSTMRTDTAAGMVGGMNPIRLPDGTTLNASPNGIESRLATFIAGSEATNSTSWFDFDRLNFASNSATITPESQEQVGNIAKILKAYPNANIKIGGYTDNQGNAAANKKLSADRAAAVKAALVSQGIAANRIETEGYGADHPIADNSTEEGRMKNRRISVLVTKK